MHDNTPLIALLAVSLSLALIFGFIAAKLRLPPLVGYLVAGICCGPTTPGFVGDQAIAHELAEIGVILLMFGVGMHFSLRDLLAVRRVALPGALIQTAGVTALGILMTGTGAGASAPASCSASRWPSPAPSCCCARWRTPAACTPWVRASWSAGWWSRTC